MSPEVAAAPPPPPSSLDLWGIPSLLNSRGKAEVERFSPALSGRQRPGRQAEQESNDGQHCLFDDPGSQRCLWRVWEGPQRGYRARCVVHAS